jgi:type 1 fimbria pilin
MKMLLAFAFLLHVGGAKAQSDVNFSGTLVQEPCTLSPDSSDITVDFRSVVIPYLYTNEHSPPELFRIRLTDCDTSLGARASVQFTGTEDADQPGLLAMGAGSLAQGVAIGIHTLKGEAVPINKPSRQFTLSDGNTTIYLAAYVQASPLAKQNKNIVAGAFNATATFEMIYD